MSVQFCCWILAALDIRIEALAAIPSSKNTRRLEASGAMYNCFIAFIMFIMFVAFVWMNNAIGDLLPAWIDLSPAQ
jgi:hypothetical protein